MNYTIEELQDKIKTIANLPTLPHIAAKLMQIVSSPTVSAGTVARLVSQDVSLSAKVLRLANSAFYGVPKSITTLNNAVIILGFKIIQTMVLSLTVFDMFVKDGDNGRRNVFDRAEFWRHSLRCGAISRLLTHKRRRSFAANPEEAFCAGLLHDIGKIVMEQYLNADLRIAMRYASENRLTIFEAERIALGYTHCDVASWLTGSWSLPDEIVQPLVYHHEAEEATICPDAVMTCHIADILSKIKDGDTAAKEEAIGALEEKAKALELTRSDLEAVIEEIPVEVERASPFIS